MKARNLIGLITCVAVAVLSGCGGRALPARPATQPTAAVLKLSTRGALPSGDSIAAIDVTVSLPAGVTVKADGTGQTLAGTVVPSGVAAGSTAVASFTPASGGNPARTRIVMINVTGFGTGEFATVNCDIAAGNPPKATDFGLTGFAAASLTGTPLSGLTPALAADIR